MQNKQDVIAQRYAVDFSIPIELAQILARRFPEYDKARAFLYPDLTQIYSPETLPDLNPAVERLLSALKNNNPILIYCHDDPDGYTSAVLLFKTLCDIRHKNEPNIFIYPIVREKDGYVLNPDVIADYQKKGVSTVITVDFGISNLENFRIAQEMKLDFIVCDHHELSFCFLQLTQNVRIQNIHFVNLPVLALSSNYLNGFLKRHLVLRQKNSTILKKNFWQLQCWAQLRTG